MGGGVGAVRGGGGGFINFLLQKEGGSFLERVGGLFERGLMRIYSLSKLAIE